MCVIFSCLSAMQGNYSIIRHGKVWSYDEVSAVLCWQDPSIQAWQGGQCVSNSWFFLNLVYTSSISRFQTTTWEAGTQICGISVFTPLFTILILKKCCTVDLHLISLHAFGNKKYTVTSCGLSRDMHVIASSYFWGGDSFCRFLSQAKAKADKNRRELEENLLKQTHQQRQEVRNVTDRLPNI